MDPRPFGSLISLMFGVKSLSNIRNPSMVRKNVETENTSQQKVVVCRIFVGIWNFKNPLIFQTFGGLKGKDMITIQITFIQNLWLWARTGGCFSLKHLRFWVVSNPFWINGGPLFSVDFLGFHQQRVANLTQVGLITWPSGMFFCFISALLLTTSPQTVTVPKPGYMPLTFGLAERGSGDKFLMFSKCIAPHIAVSYRKFHFQL